MVEDIHAHNPFTPSVCPNSPKRPSKRGIKLKAVIWGQTGRRTQISPVHCERQGGWGQRQTRWSCRDGGGGGDVPRGTAVTSPWLTPSYSTARLHAGAEQRGGTTDLCLCVVPLPYLSPKPGEIKTPTSLRLGLMRGRFWPFILW